MKNLKIYLLAISIISLEAIASPIYGKFDQVSYEGKLTQIITPWNSEAGIITFEKAKYKKDFYHLAHNYQPQKTPVYCGIASSAIILNALYLEDGEILNSKNKLIKPKKHGGDIVDFKFYTQKDVFNKKTDLIKEKAVIEFKKVDPKTGKYSPGLTLMELSNLLKSHNLNVSFFYAKNDPKKGIKSFKKHLKSTLNKKDKYILANFYSKTIGRKGGGHISPIVAYNEDSNEILILDVASHKHPWYWVKLDMFYISMQQKDGDKPRGYLIVKS